MITTQSGFSAGITIVATSLPDELGVDLTFIINNTEGSAGTFNIPLMLADLPDFLETLNSVVGSVWFDCTEDVDAVDDTYPANGMGETIVDELSKEDK